MQTSIVTPSFMLKAFHCPYCGAFAQQNWQSPYQFWPPSHDMVDAIKAYFFSQCFNCKRLAIWQGQVMVFPVENTTPSPHPDLPDSVKADYEEAGSVLQKSPRATAALLRLCIQKLCIELGEDGKNINNDIASLVTKGLPIRVQQALDIVRVIGNEQVHPDELDVRDNPEIATELFHLVNFIVEDRISRPKAIEELYARLPQNKLEGIRQRDAAARQTSTSD